MSFFKKVKSLFQNQYNQSNVKNESIEKQQVEPNQQPKPNVQQGTYEPPTYKYKTAKEKAAEPIPPEERKWILRFQNQECPNCHYIFEQIKGNRKCPECKNKVIVRTHYQTKEKCLLSEEEVPLFDAKKDYYYDIRWCVRECGSLLEVTEEQFMDEWEERGQAYSPFDIVNVFVNKKGAEYIRKELWGFYRNTISLRAQNFGRWKKDEEAYRTYLQLAFIDANGPQNNRKPRFLPSSDDINVSRIKFYGVKLDKTLEEIKQDFYAETREENSNDLYPLSSEEVWNLIEAEYDRYELNFTTIEKNDR
ncbi:hypothetical protein MZM54_05185 [[Brevibacterium] frigoritolerans]|nr:hypothetical protein [Peribacillus frigoritolerans]